MQCVNLGRIGYGEALELQKKLFELRLSGRIPDTLLLLEHDPVITIGTAGGDENVLVAEERLLQAGIEVYHTDRGGNITYHGPGQLVGYPIFDLRNHGRDVHLFLRNLEQCVIGVLAHYGIRGEAVPKLTGVWVGGDKICSIGVAVRRWISYHGFALNVSPDFAHWSFIHPCGLAGKEVTSIERILGAPVEMAEVKALAAEKVGEVFGHFGVRWLDTAFRQTEGDVEPSHSKAVSSHRTPKRIPEWLTVKAPRRGMYEEMARFLESMGLHTVCQSASCPNIGECFSRHTATFMILGNSCTRNCGFCGVAHDGPTPVDADEPRRVAEASVKLGLEYVVVTSVTRDDLPDGGAHHFAETIRCLKASIPEARVEVLVPDFQGDRVALETVLAAEPFVLNHNVETVPRLYSTVRPQADYHRSLAVLETSARFPTSIYVKSGLMLGLGEKQGEVVEVLSDLRRAGCDIVTIGQYLQPSRKSLPVVEYIPPSRFEEYERVARDMGFKHVASGPFVRSSYHAAEISGIE